jgi:hypothetical protein
LTLAAMGVRAVVVHEAELGEAARRWNARAIAAGGLRRAAAFGTDVVYRLPAAPSR